MEVKYYKRIVMQKKPVLRLFLMLAIIMVPLQIAYSAEKDTLKNFRLMKEKKMRSILNEVVDEISNDCCEDNFEDKEKLLQIKTDLINCLNSEDKKCFKFLLVYIKKPEKLIILEKVEESKKLLLENKRLRYDNKLLKQEEELALKKQQASQNYDKLQASQNYDKLKEAYDLLEGNNNQLKKRIESILESYDKRIIELEEANTKLKEEYAKAFEMLPKYKQKKLQKESASE